jgi:hypothetical protein
VLTSGRCNTCDQCNNDVDRAAHSLTLGVLIEKKQAE